MVGAALFDTVILIDFLNGVRQARKEIHRYPDRAISLITWMEVMAGAPSDQEQATALFLGTFINVAVTPAIARQAVQLRRQTKLKLPDAIILATAQVEKRVLLTRNTKDFKDDRLSVLVPYRL
ncbi:MAG: type II toxin-antitoxin system VapC family toxin [Edaphobacter sp.]